MLSAQRLQQLYEILTATAWIHEPQALLHEILQRTCRGLEAEAGALFTLERSSDDVTGQLVLASAFGPKADLLQAIPFPIGSGICGWVARTGEPALVDDPEKDPRFNPAVDSQTGYRTQTLLAAPLLYAGRTTGVLEVLNKRQGPFTHEDLEWVQAIGRQAAAALAHVRLYDEISRLATLNESILESMPGGFIAIDPTGRVIVCNASAASILHIPKEAAVGRFVEQGLAAAEPVTRILWDTLQRQRVVRRQEVEIPGGKTLGYSTLLIRDRTGGLLGAGIVFTDLSAVRTSR